MQYKVNESEEEAWMKVDTDGGPSRPSRDPPSSQATSPPSSSQATSPPSSSQATSPPSSSQPAPSPSSSQASPSTSASRTAPTSSDAVPPSSSQPMGNRPAQAAGGTPSTSRAPPEVWTQLELINRQFEVSEHAPMPPQPVLEIMEGWYSIFIGRYVGCFTSSEIVTAFTSGWSGNSSKKHGSYHDMYFAWKSACTQGRVHGKMSPQSIVPYIVSDKEAQQRLDQLLAQVEDMSMSEDEDQPVTSTAAPTAAPAAPTAAPAAPTAAPAPTAVPAASRAPPAASKDAPAAPNDAPAAPNDAPVAPTAVPLAFASDASSSSSMPTPTPTPVAPSRVAPVPPAWVVVRGLRPGVYYDRDAYMAARGSSRSAWAFPAPTAEAADDLYIQHFASCHTLPC
ncbi:hypothetical protein PsYK624_170640 [Phanerochaete sordida]|uniref:Uncharacterized protein n=1 Tax=Phanerochaete sordida TaxID=48140 RepID=A0A9P3GSK8_9APHY|nr:hypothetical protein PsYK624_170640 [Phanerochaete sordida]